MCVCVFYTGGVTTCLILRKMLSKSFFISTRVRVWSRKRSFICCSRTLDSPLKLISISLVFSKRSSLFSQQFSKATIILISQFAESKADITCMQVNWAQPHCYTILYWAVQRSREATSAHRVITIWYSHVSLSLDDSVNILRVDHAQHPVTEHARCRGLHHDEHQDKKKAANTTFVQKCIFLVSILNIIIFDTTRKLNYKINWQSQLDSVTLIHLKSSSGAVNSNCYVSLWWLTAASLLTLTSVTGRREDDTVSLPAKLATELAKLISANVTSGLTVLLFASTSGCLNNKLIMTSKA